MSGTSGHSFVAPLVKLVTLEFDNEDVVDVFEDFLDRLLLLLEQLLFRRRSDLFRSANDPPPVFLLL